MTSAATGELALIECAAEPRHAETYYRPEPDDWYPPACAWCAYDAVFAAHRGCEHSHHRAWRRWRVTGWLRSNLYTSGITRDGGSWRYGGGGCTGCQTMPRLWGKGRRVYVLWVRVDHWRCILRGHHWPADPIAFGYCSKCLPCPDCGSKTAGHEPSCPEVSGVAGRPQNQAAM